MINLLRLDDLKCFYYSQLFSLIVRTPVVELEFKLFRQFPPCKYCYP